MFFFVTFATGVPLYTAEESPLWRHSESDVMRMARDKGMGKSDVIAFWQFWVCPSASTS